MSLLSPAWLSIVFQWNFLYSSCFKVFVKRLEFSFLSLLAGVAFLQSTELRISVQWKTILFQTLKCKEMFQNCLWWYDTDFQILLLEILIQWVKYEVGNLFSEYLPMIQGMSYKILTSRAYRKWAYHDKV